MKVLVLQIVHSKLPDDFEGTLSDGLRSLADYHDSMTGTPQQDLRPLEDDVGEVSFRKANAVLFDRFLDSVRDGRRCVGTVQIVSYDLGSNTV